MIFAPSVCQYSAMAYLDITVRKHMQKKPSDELISLQSHNFYTVIIGVVTPFESDMSVLNLEDTVIADCYPVGIPAQVLKDSINAVKRGFAIDDPFLTVELSK